MTFVLASRDEQTRDQTLAKSAELGKVRMFDIQWGKRPTRGEQFPLGLAHQRNGHRLVKACGGQRFTDSITDAILEPLLAGA